MSFHKDESSHNAPHSTSQTSQMLKNSRSIQGSCVQPHCLSQSWLDCALVSKSCFLQISPVATVLGLGYRIQGLLPRDKGLGFRVQGLEKIYREFGEKLGRGWRKVAELQRKSSIISSCNSQRGWSGASISNPNYSQPPNDECDGQKVHNLVSRKGLVDEPFPEGSRSFLTKAIM